MHAGGSNQRVLTPNETTALSPAFPADGRVAYSRDAPIARWQIVSVKSDGSGERLESDASNNDYWAPARGHSAGTWPSWEAPLLR